MGLASPTVGSEPHVGLLTKSDSTHSLLPSMTTALATHTGPCAPGGQPSQNSSVENVRLRFPEVLTTAVCFTHRSWTGVGVQFVKPSSMASRERHGTTCTAGVEMNKGRRFSRVGGPSCVVELRDERC